VAVRRNFKPRPTEGSDQRRKIYSDKELLIPWNIEHIYTARGLAEADICSSNSQEHNFILFLFQQYCI